MFAAPVLRDLDDGSEGFELRSAPLAFNAFHLVFAAFF